MLPIQKLFSSNERIFKVNFEGITQNESSVELDILKKVLRFAARYYEGRGISPGPNRIVGKMIGKEDAVR